MSIFTEWIYPNSVWQVKDDINDVSWNRLNPQYLQQGTTYDIYAKLQVTVANVQCRAASLVTADYNFGLPDNANIVAIEARVTRRSSLLPGVDMHWKHNDLYNDIDNVHQYPPKDNDGNLVVIRSGVIVPFGEDNTIYLRHETWGNFQYLYKPGGGVVILSELTPEFVSSSNFQFYIKMGLNSWDGVMDVESSIHIKDVALRVEYNIPSEIDDINYNILQLGTF